MPRQTYLKLAKRWRARNVRPQAAMNGQQFELATELLRFVMPPGAGDAFLNAVRRPAADVESAEGAAEQMAAVTLQPSSPPAQQPKSAGVRLQSSQKPQKLCRHV